MSRSRTSRHELAGHVVLVTLEAPVDGLGWHYSWRTVAGPVRACGGGYALDNASGVRQRAKREAGAEIARGGRAVAS